MRVPRALFTVGFWFVLSSAVALNAQDLRSGGAKANLDLPAGPVGAAEEDEKESLETISFLGYEFQGNAFFFVSSERKKIQRRTSARVIAALEMSSR